MFLRLCSGKNNLYLRRREEDYISGVPYDSTPSQAESAFKEALEFILDNGVKYRLKVNLTNNEPTTHGNTYHKRPQ